eukprot:15437384-Alexandrium_andersonii.AAC.1
MRAFALARIRGPSSWSSLTRSSVFAVGSIHGVLAALCAQYSVFGSLPATSLCHSFKNSSI